MPSYKQNEIGSFLYNYIDHLIEYITLMNRLGSTQLVVTYSAHRVGIWNDKKLLKMTVSARPF